MNDRSAFRRARILCTVGPASRDPAVFRQLVEAGMDGVRVNFSHSTHEDAARTIALARAESERVGRPIAVLADLQGPKIRVGDLPEPMEVVAGERYLLVPEEDESPAAGDLGPVRIPTTYAELSGDVAPGNRVLFDDGRIALRVESVAGREVLVEAIEGGTLGPGKGINLPGIEVSAPSLTEKDLDDLAFALDAGVDFVALSFVRRPADVEGIRKIVAGRALLIAKIEMGQALRRLAEILRTADGVMVARGDLGVELDFEEVPIVQKRILRLTRESAKLGITATQMLESMIESPRPTRAEVSDVANALLDGTDAVMLSGETAVGAHPAEAVATMNRIIRRIERERTVGNDGFEPMRLRGVLSPVHHTVAGAIAGAAAEATERLGAPFLVTFTRSGYTAWLVGAQRVKVPVIAVTDQPRTWSQLALAWGVVPVLYEGEVSYDGMLEMARGFAVDNGLGNEGDPFVVTAGLPFHVAGTTNYMRIETL